MSHLKIVAPVKLKRRLDRVESHFQGFQPPDQHQLFRNN